MTRANALNSLPTTLVYVDAQTGSDINGNGSFMNPFATIAHAYSTISDNSSTKIYTLILSGTFTVASLVCKPFINLQGINTQQTILAITGGSNNLTLDTSWSNTTGAIWSINNINFNVVGTPSNIYFDFTALTSETDAEIYVNNCYVGAATFICTTTEFIQVASNQFTADVTATDATYFSYYTFYSGVSTCTASTTPGNGSIWESAGDTIENAMQINCNNATGAAAIILTGCSCTLSSVTLQGDYPANTTFEYDWASYPDAIYYGAGADQASNVRFNGVEKSLFPLSLPQITTNAAPSSDTATNGFASSLTLGTPIQNTLGYDILVNITFIITAATTATISLGVGPTSSPTTNTAIASFSTTGLATISAVVPASYYLLVTKTGTLTSSNSIVASPL